MMANTPDFTTATACSRAVTGVAAFGQLVSGFEVLDRIADLPTHGPESWNKPLEMPVMTSIRIEMEE